MPGRQDTATDQYRYGFDGQEKSDEVALNTTTAEFWEYDSRIGRRWNIDRKPSIVGSPYHTFNNSPILFSDPRGDTTRIKWGGIAGDKNNISYVGGKWIDTKTRQEFIADKNTPTRVIQKINDYNTLHTISGLEDMLQEIDDNSRTIFLRTDEGKTDLGDIKDKEDRHEPTDNATINVGSLKTRMEAALQMDEKKTDIPSYVAMTHELGHVHDYLFNLKRFNNGWRNFTTKYETQDPDVLESDRSVTWSEINAMYFENIARVHANISPRAFYTSNRGVPEYGGLAAISPGDFQIIKLNTDKGWHSRVYINLTFSSANGDQITLLVPYLLTHPANQK